MAKVSIVFTCRWESEQTDCRECSACKDMIVSDMWRLMIVTKYQPKVKVSQSDDPTMLVVDININQKVRQTDVVICSSCHEVIEIK